MSSAYTRTRRPVLSLLVVAVLACTTVAAWAQEVTTRTPGSPAVRQLRLAALGYIEKGQWASANASIDQLLGLQADDPVGLELRRQMQRYRRVEDVRRTQRKAAYDESIGRVRELIAAQNWEESLGEAIHAADLADAKSDLQKLDWFATLVEKNVEGAQAHGDKGEWLKATSVYSQLSSLYENEDNQYRDQARKTARYARLEAIYKDKDQAERQLEKIDEGMLADALEQISRFYVRKPDYLKMTEGGLDYLAAMTEVPTLKIVFESLADKEKCDDFRKRLNEVKEESRSRDHMGLQELARAYLQAKRINAETVKLPEAAIIREFFDGAIDPLDDFSSMVWPVDKSDFEKSIGGEFSGVGIQISLEDGQLTVVSPLEDTPAYRAGIQAGDVILKIDGEATQGITLDQAVQKITGPAGTKVVLTVRRATSAKLIDFELTRDRIRIQTVKGFNRDADGHWQYMIDQDYRIGYVRITNYMKRTVEELEKAMDEMANQNVRGLVIDLRFNPGGLLQQAVEMSDLFIDDGVIVSTEGMVRRVEERAHAGGTNLTLPIIVLVNDFSASAAEIVSGALKDSKRALIVGQRTYGKGSVQNVIPVGSERNALGEPKAAPAYLKLTTAHYFLPSGRSIHRTPDSKDWGVHPDVAVKVTRDEVQDILDLRRDSDVISAPNLPPTTQPESAPTTQPDRVKVDPQVEVGLLILRAELLKKKI